MDRANFTLLHIEFLHTRAAYRVNLNIKVDACTCCYFPSEKNPPVEAIFGMVVHRPIDAFRTTATHQ
jgi:hypothetical protein